MKHLVLLSLLLGFLLAMASAIPAEDEEQPTDNGEAAVEDESSKLVDEESTAKKTSKEEESKENVDKDHGDEEESEESDNDDDDDDDDDEEHNNSSNDNDSDDEEHDNNVKDDDNDKDESEGRSYSAHTSPMAEFAVNLFQSMSHHTTKSFFMSPFSVWQTLNLALHGSAGETKNQLKEALYGYKDTKDYKEIGADLSHLHKVMNVINKVYITKESKLKKSTLQEMLKQIKPHHKSFKGSTNAALLELEDFIQPVDFRQRDDVIKLINNDVKDATKNMITELVTKDHIETDTKMVLVNAIYFKGDWKVSFNKNATKKEDFHYWDGKEKKTEKVDMMKNENNNQFNFGISKTLRCSILELPYISPSDKKDTAVSMFVFLPDEGTKVQDFMDKINPDHLLKKLPQLRREKINLWLPKFKMEVKLEDNLIKGIEDQGITNMFDDQKAELTEFLHNKADLVVSKVVHKAVIQVDEVGTTAAAATGISFLLRSAPLPPKEFHCNRPFVFMIVDKEYNNPIFTGVVRNPNDLQPVKEEN